MCALDGVRLLHSRIILQDPVYLSVHICRLLSQIISRTNVCRNVHQVLITLLIISQGLVCFSARLACLLTLPRELVCRAAQLDPTPLLNPVWECASQVALRPTMLQIWLNNVWDYARIYQLKLMLRMWVVSVRLDAWIPCLGTMSLENVKPIVSLWQNLTQTQQQIYALQRVR